MKIAVAFTLIDFEITLDMLLSHMRNQFANALKKECNLSLLETIMAKLCFFVASSTSNNSISI